MSFFGTLFDITSLPGQITEAQLHPVRGYNTRIAWYGILQDAMIYKQMLEDQGVKAVIDGEYISGYRVWVKR